MFLVRPPLFLRWLVPGVLWRMKPSHRNLYLSFDDGPVPEVTPWVLDVLKAAEVKATFFCVGDNVRKHPAIFQRILDEGHHVGNHSFDHMQAFKHSKEDYLLNVEKADQYISSSLFRPPHGQINWGLRNALNRRFKLVMWDVLSGDYDKKRSGEACFRDVVRYARPGSIIVFHDSIKAKPNLEIALPLSLIDLKAKGYKFKTIPYTIPQGSF